MLAAGGETEVGEVAGLGGAVPGVVEDLPGVSPNGQTPSWGPADTQKLRVPHTPRPPAGGWFVEPWEGGRDEILDNRNYNSPNIN